LTRFSTWFGRVFLLGQARFGADLLRTRQSCRHVCTKVTWVVNNSLLPRCGRFGVVYDPSLFSRHVPGNIGFRTFAIKHVRLPWTKGEDALCLGPFANRPLFERSKAGCFWIEGHGFDFSTTDPLTRLRTYT